MTTFYVGQRVRVREETSWPGGVWGPDPRGQQGVVLGVGEFEGGDGRQYEYVVEVHGRCGSIVANGDELEPIQYDGNKVIEWSECLWQPSHETA